MSLRTCLFVLFSYLFLVAATSPKHGVQLDTRGQSTNPGLTTLPLSSRDLPTGTCNAQTPCANGACCSSTNLCGYSKAFCGTGCQSNCNAKSQCGFYAPSTSQVCPLNVCCSEFGFCGSTPEFCTWSNPADPLYSTCDTKYGGCGDVKRPSCTGGNSAGKRTIGYYESWSNIRKCSSVAPEDLNLAGFTHINFAFAFFDPTTFQITPMDANGASLYSRFTGLKAKQSGLQTWISVGGWSFTDPGPTQTAFSDMTSSQGSRAKFIQGLIQFMNTYGFDGVDLDWEYPGADDRGGKSADSANYVLLAQDMRAAFGTKYGISVTLPTSYWYLQHFDLPGIQKHVDWFNLMAYDLHGVWDAQSKFVGPYIAPHTNITEIDIAMDLLWRSGVTPDMVVLGQGFYGRSFTLSDPSCNVPNGICQFSGAANPGPCSNAGGILNDQEINAIISQNNLKPVWDQTAGVKWITWDSNQWVSYDDADTFKQKKDLANSRCLGGLLVWAMDQVDQTVPNGLGLDSGVTSSQQSDAQQLSADQAAGVTCRTTACGAGCPVGTTKVTETNGQPGQLSTTSRCPKGQYQSVCCNDGTTMGKCQWRGYRGAGLSCLSGCAAGETEITTNKNNHDKKKGDQTCNGGLQSYCCAGFKPGPSTKQLEQAAEDAAKAAAEAAAEQAALDIAAKAFCRLAVPALLAPLEILEDLIPIVGEILDIAEIAATPALIQGCVKGIEKEGKAEFKVFGKEHTLSMDKPTAKPSEDRPPTTSHEPPKTSTKDDSCSVKARGLDKRAPNCMTPVTSYTDTTTLYNRVEKICDAGRWPQACFHYSSAISVANNPRFNPVTCSEFVPARNFMAGSPATSRWAREHNSVWRKWMRLPQGKCDMDEWPPQHFWQGDAGQIVRLLPESDNTGAASLWNAFCPEHAAARCVPGSERVHTPSGRGAVTTFCKKELTLKVMSMVFEFEDAPISQIRDFGFEANPCYPKTLVDDPTFALNSNDAYFIRNGVLPNPLWAAPPNPNLIGNQGPPFGKRDLNPNEFAFMSDNSSRRLTQRELDEVGDAIALRENEERLRLLREQMEEQLAYVDCIGDDCATELRPMMRASMVSLPDSTRTAPSLVEATATTVTMSLDALPTQLGTQIGTALSRSGVGRPVAPEVTDAVQHEDLKFLMG